MFRFSKFKIVVAVPIIQIYKIIFSVRSWIILRRNSNKWNEKNYMVWNINFYLS